MKNRGEEGEQKRSSKIGYQVLALSHYHDNHNDVSQRIHEILFHSGFMVLPSPTGIS